MALTQGTRVRHTDRRIGTVTVDSSNVSALVRFDGNDATEAIMLENLETVFRLRDTVAVKLSDAPEFIGTVRAISTGYVQVQRKNGVRNWVPQQRCVVVAQFRLYS